MQLKKLFSPRNLLLRVIPAALVLMFAGAAAQAAEDLCPADGPQNQAACLREKAAAKQEIRAGRLSTADQATMERNALSRCVAFKTDSDRAACEARVKGPRAGGSVGGGGQLLEATTTVPQ